jgi:hypothetical protein
MPKYNTDIKLGERYGDEQTGTTGVATAITFYQYACERVNLEVVVRDGELKDYGFDAPRLTHVETRKRATTKRPGGPGEPAPPRPSGAR